MTRTWMTATCALLLLAAPVRAQDGDQTGRVRRWSVGWQEGITLRRAVDVWDFSISAGPSDWLNTEDTYTWSTNLPDSLQGIRTRTVDDRSESGFVRLGAARELSRWRDFSLHGTVDGMYNWGHSQNVTETYNTGSGLYDRRVTGGDGDTWTLSVGLRVAWRPVPFLGIQTRLGLSLRSTTGTGTTSDSDTGSGAGGNTTRPGRTIQFDDYGYTGTGSLEFFVWF